MSTASNHRRQLTLFVTEPWRSRLDALRQVLDPVQASLIAAHVTLCREDEIERLDTASIVGRARSWPCGPLTLFFGRPQRFGGHGALLPCEQGSDQFRQLRQWLLQDRAAREHYAHLTLAHPRNPESAGNTDAALDTCPLLPPLQFASVAVIEQYGSSPWTVIGEAVLGSAASGVAGALAPADSWRPAR
jgi:hypothetical protein